MNIFRVNVRTKILKSVLTTAQILIIVFLTLGVDSMKELGNKLKILQEGTELSQVKFAEVIGSMRASINRYENGQATPSVELLCWQRRRGGGICPQPQYVPDHGGRLYAASAG